jgi:WhiB family redox-sensing transcriptional regulator
MMNLDWMQDALCAEVGGDLWFPENGENPAEALAVCRRCPVQEECLDHADEIEGTGRYTAMGIWGGMTSAQRRSRRRLRVAA